MKKSICDRVLGLILILAMLIVGIGYGKACASSLFSVNQSDASVLMKITNELETRAYLEKTSSEVLESILGSTDIVRQAVRGVTGFSKVSYALMLSLLLIGICLLSIYNCNSSFLTNACHNQYRQRTLEYIHHKDGKKSIL
jgi:hypothetical protein